MGVEERKCEAAGGIGRRRSRIEKRDSFCYRQRSMLGGRCTWREGEGEVITKLKLHYIDIIN